MGKVRGTNSAKTRSKSRKLNFKRECKCQFHDEFSTLSSDGDKLLYNTSSHDVKNIGHLRLLIEHRYLTKKKQLCLQWLFSICWKKSRQRQSKEHHF